MKKWKKPLSILSATALLSGVLFTSTADAASAVRKVDAQYKDIKIINNSQSVTIDPKTEPFMLNGTTYVPLRMISEMFNKSVQWSGTTNTIIIKDTTPQISQSTITALTTQIKDKDTQIANLQAEINKLKAANEKVDLDDLEKQLNKDYDDYFDGDVDDIEIYLGGDEDDIDVSIELNGDDWGDLTDREKEDFLQDIVDDILADFKDADISGTVDDADDSDELASFDVATNGDVSLDDEDADSDLADLEDDLNDTYEDYDSDLRDVEITLDGDEDDIDITIEINGDDWDDLSDSEKEDFLQDIVDDIFDEFEDAEVDGVVKDADNSEKLDDFYADGSDDGDVEIN